MEHLRIQENVPLKNYTTFRVGGPARYFIEADDVNTLMTAFDCAQHWGLPIFILGQGSNLLVADKGFNGIVIKNNARTVRYQNGIIVAESGATMAAVTKVALEESLTGMEWAAGLPGTVGGAVINNSGCNGREMKDVVRKICYFKDGKINTEEIWNKQDEIFNFGYRTSWFKRNKTLILEVQFRHLSNGRQEEIRNKMHEYVRQRSHTQPHGFTIGCIFKNPVLLERGTLSAGKLIDDAGLKGTKVGSAQVSTVHGNFILNLKNRATAEEIMKLIEVVEREVEKVSGIKLEREIICLGFEK